MRARALAALGIGAMLALASAAPAAADSLVFVRDNNVWLSNPDGSGQYQVTLDGTAASPYESPSQANDGTVLALRAPAGGRNQLWRMTQSGRLLNAPANTPAPGTGAIDTRISPDGRLAAYWFVTTVSDPLCTFCVDAANQAGLSYSDRFTNYNEIGTPNTGGWPSWIGNDTIVIGNGSATIWYYKLGMPEANDWFALHEVIAGELFTLLDADAAPTTDRLAVVRGDNQETLLLLKMNGLPPAKPSVANPTCNGFASPTGKFVDPTWSTDGRMLAWQENDGVWVSPIPADLADCSGIGPATLRIPGAKTPDFGPAAINPGARPPCGNPGNPTACTNPPCTTCAPGEDVAKKLSALLTAEAKALGRLGIRGLLKKKRTRIAYTAGAPGALALRLTGSPTASRATLLASGRKSFAAAGTAKVALNLTRKGTRVLRRARGVRARLRATFTPVGGTPTTASRKIRLKR